MKRYWLGTAAAIALSAGVGFASAHDMHYDPHDPGAGTQASASYRAHAGDGYSVEELIGMDVRGRDGEALGEVQDIILSREGVVTATVVSAGGILGVGESSYLLPWSHVSIDERSDRVTVRLDGDAVALFRWNADDVRLRANEVLASNVIGGDLALRDGMRAGEIDDLIVGRNGELDALIVSSDLNGSGDAEYAYPFTGEVAFNADADIYTADIGFDEARRLPRFDDHDAFDIDISAVGSTSHASGGGEVRSH